MAHAHIGSWSLYHVRSTMTSLYYYAIHEVHGHHCRTMCAWVCQPNRYIQMACLPPTISLWVLFENREREREKGKEGGRMAKRVKMHSCSVEWIRGGGCECTWTPQPFFFILSMDASVTNWGWLYNEMMLTMARIKCTLLCIGGHSKGNSALSKCICTCSVFKRQYSWTKEVL